MFSSHCVLFVYPREKIVSTNNHRGRVSQAHDVPGLVSYGSSVVKHTTDPGANVIKLFTAVIYCCSTVIPSFCVIK
jgi:hypothetical protein